MAATKPKNTFISTPATETTRIPYLNFLKLRGFICTGFAQPKPNNKKQINPLISKCFKGFIVNLPWIFGVKSPILYAAKAWANSCKERDIKNTTTLKTSIIIASSVLKLLDKIVLNIKLYS